MRQLILVHGRSQEGKDSKALKAEWVEAWKRGLAKSGLTNPLADSDIRFPYYGDTLVQMLAGLKAEEAADIVVRGPAPGGEAEAMMREMIQEIATTQGISEEDVLKLLSQDVIQRGPLNWGWVQGILQALDSIGPVSKKLVALTTADVSHYMTDAAARAEIDRGVCSAVTPGIDAVVVSHSLGTVVAYSSLMGKSGTPWPGVRVPLFVTLGSPLAVTAVKSRLRPHAFPPAVGHWLNAMDEDDVVSLHPLTSKHFNTGRTIENDITIDNRTSNQHGIDGYLDDKDVARRIYEVLVAT
jgi:hypothetical protein